MAAMPAHIARGMPLSSARKSTSGTQMIWQSCHLERGWRIIGNIAGVCCFLALPAGKNAVENQEEQQRKDHAEHILRDTQTDRAFESVCAGCNSERTERVEHSLTAISR